MVTAVSSPSVTTRQRESLSAFLVAFHGSFPWMSCVDSSWSSWRWITLGTSCLISGLLLRTWHTRTGHFSLLAFITHFCAPVFAFLAGTGAFLSTSRGKSLQQVSHFFLTRGLWLVLLELTIIDFAWGFVPWAHAGVIWILGWSMVAMALIVRLPVRWIAVLGLGMIATHNCSIPLIQRRLESSTGCGRCYTRPAAFRSQAIFSSLSGMS